MTPAFLSIQSDWMKSGTPFLVATVVKVEGSAPREPGAKMLIAKNGKTHDTIGGGAFEGAVIERATHLLNAKKGPELFEYTLGPEYGMRCGGKMTVFLEPSPALDKLFLYGAGHVAKPLISLAQMLGFYTVVVDERPEFNSPDRFPGAQERRIEPAKLSMLTLPSSEDTYIVILTRDAELDYDILTHYLDQPAKYIGMIGSKTKLESFRAKLRQSGKDPSVLERVHSPIGLDIDADTPEEIAVSIAAQLIAVRRGAGNSNKSSPPSNPGNKQQAKTSHA